MIDPVMRDLDRHMSRVDADDAMQEWVERVREEDPDAYADLTDDELARELERQAAESAAEAMFED